MALIKCPECGGDVSSTDDTCIHCGFKYTSEYRYEHGYISEKDYLEYISELPYQEAMPLYEKLANKKCLFACKVIGKCYLKGLNGYPVDLVKAKEQYSKFKEDVECLYYLALIFEKENKGDGKPIIENYKKVLAVEGLPVEFKGEIYNNMGAYTSGEQQISYYLTAYDYGNYTAAINLLNAYIFQKEYRKAISFGKNILQDNDISEADKVEILSGIGIAYSKLHDFEEAAFYFNRAFQYEKTQKSTVG